MDKHTALSESCACPVFCRRLSERRAAGSGLEGEDRDAHTVLAEHQNWMARSALPGQCISRHSATISGLTTRDCMDVQLSPVPGLVRFP